MPVEQQVVVIFAATKGYLDNIQIGEISAFEQGILKEVSTKTLEAIRKEKQISKELGEELTKFFDEFTPRFVSSRVKK